MEGKTEQVEPKTGLRMYFLVPYNIMSIQKGIQSGHVAEQYAFEILKKALSCMKAGAICPSRVLTDEVKLWMEYVEHHKTWIILNGGTSNNSRDPEKRGSLNLLLDQLIIGNCEYSTFYEPDINDALTGICFLADEKVWDFDRYPTWDKWSQDLWELYQSYDAGSKEPDMSEKAYAKFVGGKQNVVLKEIIYKRPLAV